MKVIYSSMMIILLLSCKERNSSQQISNTEFINSDSIKTRYQVDSIFVEQMIDSLYTLDLVKDAKRRIDSAHLGTVNLAFMADSMAYGNDELYIGAGESHHDRFLTFLNFYTNTKTKQIRLYDAIKEDTVDIKTYEQRLKNAVNN